MSTRHKFHKWSQEDLDSLKGIALPEKLKCRRCSKNLPQARFSTNQLNDVRRQIKVSLKVIKPITCQDCTGQQLVEVECTMCGKTKGLEEFSKAQRRSPDTAKCYSCVEKVLEQDAIEEDKYEDPDKAFVSLDHSNGKYPEYFSPATADKASSHGDHDWQSVNENRSSKHKAIEATNGGGIPLSVDFQRAMSLLGTADESMINTEYAYPAGRDRGDDSWSEVHTKSWRTQSTRATSTASTIAPTIQPRSGSSVAGSVRTFASSVAEQSTISEDRPNNRGNMSAAVRPSTWAKIPAAPRGPPIRPMGDAARETGPFVDAWASDSDDADEEDSESDCDDDTVI